MSTFSKIFQITTIVLLAGLVVWGAVLLFTEASHTDGERSTVRAHGHLLGDGVYDPSSPPQVLPSEPLHPDMPRSPEDVNEWSELNMWRERLQMMDIMTQGIKDFAANNVDQLKKDHKLSSLVADTLAAVAALQPKLEEMREALSKKDLARMRKLREEMDADFQIFAAHMQLLDGILHPEPAPVPLQK